MRFFIVDDEQPHIDTLRAILEQAFPACTISSRTVTSWPKAYEWITKNVPDADDSVLLADLSLAGPLDMVEDGLRNVQQLRIQRPRLTFICYSQYTERAKADARYKAIFRGEIEKQKFFAVLDQGQTQEAISYVRSAILAVVEPSGLMDEKIFEDSYAMRQLSAAFDGKVLAELLSNVAQGYSEIQVRALTGGYSRAFLLSIAGQLHGKGQNIVVKMSRDRKVLEDELASLERHMSELGPLQGCLVNTDRSIHPLPSGSACYFRQAEVPGPDLLTTLRAADAGSQWNQLMDPLLSILLSCCDSCLAKQQKGNFGAYYVLTAMDVGRFTNSVPFLRDLACAMSKQEKWPKSAPIAPANLGVEAQRLVLDWPRFIGTLGDAFVNVQHGDLNPRNVMICQANRPVLIDLARLGHWPIAYDIARLSLQLRIRLMDDGDHMDYFPDSFEKWVVEPVGQGESEKDIASSTCPQAAYCDNALHRWLGGKGQEGREMVLRAYEVGTMWDLVKIVSYGDLPAFKRVWALYECERLTRKLSAAP